jgi:hypothetical protein
VPEIGIRFDQSSPVTYARASPQRQGKDASRNTPGEAISID